MKPQQLKARLEEEKKRLMETTGSAEGAEAGGDGELGAVGDQHPADHASATFEREKDLSILTALEEQIEDIETALAKLDDGTYGECEACGKPIGEDRLEARPAARFCVDHQRQRELL